MTEIPETPTAILLITVWSEPGTSALRARVVATTDARVAGESALLTGRDDIVERVRDWLDDFRPARAPDLTGRQDQ
ncbi:MULTISPECIES: hypothetical protein [Streptomyces]|uniref:hypothetical protein n=1 Tax=Streptomyces TaxID=1883 RepID=UPI00292D7EF5|nr:hypothetical protein [Streptomyces sp. NEAU-HV9]